MLCGLFSCRYYIRGTIRKLLTHISFTLPFFEAKMELNKYTMIESGKDFIYGFWQ